MTYGLSEKAELRAVDLRHNGFSTSFTVLYKGERLGEVNLATPGVHNVVERPCGDSSRHGARYRLQT